MDDLDALMENETPDQEVVAVMDGVLSLLGREKGWTSTCNALKEKDFMIILFQFDYMKLEIESL